MKKFYYLISLLFVFVIPSIIQGVFIWSRISLPNLISFVFGITLLGSVWDIWASRHGKSDTVWIWQFNFKETLGVKVLDVPVEEYFFYVSSSTYIIFVWESLRYVSDTGDKLMYFILPFTGLWTLLFIAIPYLIKAKSDKIISN